MTHFTVIRAYKTQIAKQHDELLISILLLLLIIPIYLGMYTSIRSISHTSIYE